MSNQDDQASDSNTADISLSANKPALVKGSITMPQSAESTGNFGNFGNRVAKLSSNI